MFQTASQTEKSQLEHEKNNWYFYVVRYDRCVQRGTLQHLKRGSCQWSGVARSHLRNVLLRNHGLVQSLEIKPYKPSKHRTFLCSLLPQVFSPVCQLHTQVLGFLWYLKLKKCTDLAGRARPRPGEPTPRRLCGAPWLTTAEGDLCFKNQDSLTSASPATLYLSDTVTRDAQLDC